MRESNRSGAVRRAVCALALGTAPAALHAQTAVVPTIDPPQTSTSGSLAADHAATGTASTATDPTTPDQTTGVEEIVVTAQKRSESVNKVPISISAVTGDALTKAGVVNTADLVRVVPGFNFTNSAYGAPVYTLRGVGFYDVSLGASPTVSVYVDEVPLPFSVMTKGASLDVQRVEVLKGPQGTLFGQNSTGGAINYIAAKPTDEFHAGGDLSFGRFNRLDAQSYVSGPISDTLSFRLAVRTEQGSDWQRSYTRDASLGRVERYNGRLLVDWRPTDRLKIELGANGWIDRSDTQAGQLILVNGTSPRVAALRQYPLAPSGDARAADWDAGADLQRNDRFYQISGRVDYRLTDALKLTALSAYQHYRQNDATDADGTALQDYLGRQSGLLKSIYNEVRLAGEATRLNWIIGGTYEHDDTNDFLLARVAQSSQPFLSNRAVNQQRVDTYAAFGNVEVEVVDRLKIQGGIRYTKQDRSFSGCLADSGDGSFASFVSAQASAANGRPIVVLPGACGSLNAQSLPVRVDSALNQDSISWRGGVSYQATARTLFYANASRGYKNGSFPTLGAARAVQLTPVVHESLLAYEAGFKTTLFNRTLQLNGAGFLYKYQDKQIRGRVVDPVLGPYSALVNIPRSRIAGAELQVDWVPVPELHLSGGGTYIASRIQGGFRNFDPYGVNRDLNGDAFPLTPKWQLSGDGEYNRPISGALRGFVGSSVTYQGATNAALGNLPIFDIKAYTLVDVRAGVERSDGKWRASLWVRNLGDTYYWNNVVTVIDTTMRYAGMPRTFGASLSLRY